MKARDFNQSASPVALDPSGNRVVYPAPNGSATVTRPIGHHGADANRSPGEAPATSSSAPATTPAAPPIGFDLAELEALMASLATQFRAASVPSDFDRLMGVSCSVLESAPTMELLCHYVAQAEDEQTEAGVTPASSDALARHVVRFADEVIHTVRALVDRREAPTQP